MYFYGRHGPKIFARLLEMASQPKKLFNGSILPSWRSDRGRSTEFLVRLPIIILSISLFR